MHLFFQKLFYPPLYRRLSQFSLMFLRMVLLLIILKIATRLNILFFASAQKVELYAVVMVLRDFPQHPSNLYSDSHYVVSYTALKLLILVIYTSSEELFNLFFQLRSLVQTRLYPCFVSHSCSHSNLCGPLADSNA
jgi:hypothetical protein